MTNYLRKRKSSIKAQKLRKRKWLKLGFKLIKSIKVRVECKRIRYRKGKSNLKPQTRLTLRRLLWKTEALVSICLYVLSLITTAFMPLRSRSRRLRSSLWVLWLWESKT